MSLGSKQSSQTQTQRQVSEPWAPQQQYLTDLFSRAQAQLNAGGMQPYEGQLVAPRSQATTTAEGMMLQQANNLAPQASGVSNYLTSLMQPGALDVANNPYLKSAIQAASQPVVESFQSVGGPLEQIRSHFTAGNSAGSGSREGIAGGLAMRSLGQTLANMSSNMTYQAYGDAQNRAMQAAGMMPQALQTALLPAQLTGQVGAARDIYQQATLDAERERFNYNQQLPWLNLQNYGNLIGGNYGGTTTGTTTTPGPIKSPLMQGLGGAATGASLAMMIPGLQPFGAAAAGIGGLLGLLG